jgi:hypothetical protein
MLPLRVARELKYQHSEYQAFDRLYPEVIDRFKYNACDPLLFQSFLTRKAIDTAKQYYKDKMLLISSAMMLCNIIE